MRAAISISASRRRGRRGFTLTDALVILAVLSVLGAIFVTRVAAARQRARQSVCSANLRQVNRAVLSYCAENHDTLPAMAANENRNLWWWYKEQVKRYVGLTGESSTNDLVFACPEDRGYSDPVPFHCNPRFDFSSYVYNGVILPGMPNIAGLPLAAVRHPQKTLLVMEWTAHAPLSWHRSRTRKNNAPFYCDAQSVAGFVDGHVSLTRIYYDGYDAAYTQDPISGYDYQYSAN